MIRSSTATTSRSSFPHDWLEQQAVRYADHRVPVGAIDVAESLGNQSRLGNAIIDRAVEEYVQGMRAGDTFPSLIAYAPGREYWNGGPLVLIDGNQRFAALTQLGATEVDVVVVRSTNENLIDRLTKTANMRNGVRPNREDTIKLAIHRIEKWGDNVSAVAADFSIPRSALEYEVLKRRARARMEDLGINATKILPGLWVRLGSIQSDVSLMAAAELVIKARLSAELGQGLAVEVNRARTEDDQIGVVKLWESRPEIQERIVQFRGGKNGAGPPPRATASPSSAVYRSMATIVSLLEKHPTPERLGGTTSAETIERVGAEWRKTATAVAKWLNRARDGGRAGADGGA